MIIEEFSKKIEYVRFTIIEYYSLKKIVNLFKNLMKIGKVMKENKEKHIISDYIKYSSILFVYTQHLMI